MLLQQPPALDFPNDNDPVWFVATLAWLSLLAAAVTAIAIVLPNGMVFLTIAVTDGERLRLHSGDTRAPERNERA